MEKGKGFLNEFHQFISRGNVMDMAVGVIIGGAFSSIITSLVDNIISPILGIFGGMNFDELSLKLGGATLEYGKFLTSVINFVIMAFVIFCLMKAVNGIMGGLSKKEASQSPEAPATRVCPYCKSEIPADATRCAYCTSELAEKA